MAATRVTIAGLSSTITPKQRKLSVWVQFTHLVLGASCAAEADVVHTGARL
jgi:hypothetical protein